VQQPRKSQQRATDNIVEPFAMGCMAIDHSPGALPVEPAGKIDMARRRVSLPDPCEFVPGKYLPLNNPPANRAPRAGWASCWSVAQGHDFPVRRGRGPAMV